ncbi:MAG: sigma 54-interacting transcriptional regulator [Bacillota bacterium]
MKVKEWMTPNPIRLTMENSLGNAAHLFITHHSDSMPIVDTEERVIGIITKTDLIEAFMNGAVSYTALGELPQRFVETIHQDADMKELCDLAMDNLLVVDDKMRLVGVLTRTDVRDRLIERAQQEIEVLNSVLESTYNGVIIVDNDGMIVRMNPSALKILNLEQNAAVGFPANTVVPELMLDEMVLNGTKKKNEKLKFRDKTLICDKVPLYKAEKIQGGVLIFRDSSEYQSIIDELDTVQRLSKKLDAVIECSYDGIYITDGEANTLRINKAYESITGLKREEMLGKNMLELEKEGYVSKSATLIVLKERRTTTIEQEFKTGRRVLVTGTPIFDDHGEITMVVTNVRDVTSLVKLQEQLKKNQELTQRYFTEIEEMRLQIIGDQDIVAKDEKMINTLRLAKRVAKVDTTVLILGETGVGKEEIAKFLHKNSKRKNNMFVKVNCGAIPENLMESELFGYEKGAFTGANKEGKMGLFEVADGGTIFLDEIGELPLEMQVRLLRVLQEQEITRVGSTKPVKIDVRILAATNRDLKEMVDAKTFREDLYYRLNVVPLYILPLRERPVDIFPLMQHFLSALNEKYGWDKSFSQDAVDCLCEYSWPGNVRELKNIVERTTIMSESSVITANDLPKTVLCSEIKNRAMPGNEIIPLKNAVESLEKQLIERAFQKYKSARRAAKALGIDPSTFVRKRQKYQE